MEPAWHQDPFGRHEWRWHDGEQWTEHVTTAGVAAVDPPIAPPPGQLETFTAPPTPVVPQAAPVVPQAAPLPQVVEMSRRYMCARHGVVTPIPAKSRDTTQRRVSGAKLTAGVLTAGTSLLFTGTKSSRGGRATILVCPTCKREVVEG